MRLLTHRPLTHGGAIALMAAAAALWSIAGVVTRQLEVVRGFEMTLWRSAFAALTVGVYLFGVRREGLDVITRMGRAGLVSGLAWCAMFCFFMVALTLTTVGNTLIVLSVAPLLTAFLAWLLLKERIAARTALAIAAAVAGMGWMFAGAFRLEGGRHLAGMAVAFGVPLASAINIVTLKRRGAQVDLIPAVFLGAVLSVLAMLPLAWPLQSSVRDIAWMALLGVVQLGLPCMLMVIAARRLSAPEVSLLALLEVVLGPVWAWLGAGEIPAGSTLAGGAVVLGALVFNELGGNGGWRRSTATS